VKNAILGKDFNLGVIGSFSCFHPWLVFSYCFLKIKLHPPLLQTKINVLNFFGLVNIGASTCDKKVSCKRLVLFTQFQQWLNNLNIPSNECPVIFVRFKKVCTLVANRGIGNFESVYTWERSNHDRY